VYPTCLRIEEHIKGFEMPDDVKGQVLDIFQKRWKKTHRPIHAAAFVLEPEFQTWEFSEEVNFYFNVYNVRKIDSCYLPFHAILYGR
jgi:hypothetical protein